MSFRNLSSAVISLVALTFSAASAQEVYSGEPLGEAIHDLARIATLVAHELSSGSSLTRTDVFRLVDGRLLAVTSRAKKLGEPFSIEALRVTSSATSKLSKKLPTVSEVKLPK
jgi:hypothetical protein